MRILVTNDDGIDAAGLTILADYLRKAVSRDGTPHEITVVAPEGERSGVSHAMTLRHHMKIRAVSENTYSCSGTPADCVIVAGLSILSELPDMVISGINRGPNLGTDIIYSGTCGAARQAALSGIPAIAVSCADYRPDLDYRACAAFVALNLEDLRSSWKEGTFVNINGPSSSEVNLEAFWAVPGRNRYYDNLKCFKGEDGFTYCSLGEGRQERSANEQADHHIVSMGLIALSLVNIHPEALHPSDWNGKAFLKTRA